MDTVTAKWGDTLCTLAMQAGFIDCAPLRALADNAPFLNRDLAKGDVVTIPPIDLREVAKGTTKVHEFVRLASPPVSIRFVHGSEKIPYRRDDTSEVLHISNYPTTKGGPDAKGPFPTAYEYQKPGHDDLDTFKVEIVDPNAGASVDVLLEAMKPIYGPDLKVIRYEPFAGDERKIKALHCAKVRSGVAYRSKYLRLVVDGAASDANVADKQSEPDQTLLVTDMADGNGTGKPGDNDTIEILDQRVRASYKLQKCPGARKCVVRKQAPIAGHLRERIAVSVHIYRNRFGGAPPAGVSEQSVRYRLFKWFRRLYAQAALAPVLVDPFITIEEPPPTDTIAISVGNGVGASGVSVGKGPSSFECTIKGAPEATAGAVPSTNMVVDLSAVPVPRTPEAVADAIIAALPAGFSGEKFVNPLAFKALVHSVDLQIKHDSGERIAITYSVNDDNVDDFLTRAVRVNTRDLFVDAPYDEMALNSAEQRRCMRQIPGDDDVLNFYCVGRLVDATSSNIRGMAVMPLMDLGPEYIPPAPLRNKAFLCTRSMELNDSLPFTFPHEAGHVLGDMFHVDKGDAIAAQQMMREGGTSDVNGESESKRISDNPVYVNHKMLDPAQPTAGAPIFRKIFCVQRVRDRGTGLLRPW